MQPKNAASPNLDPNMTRGYRKERKNCVLLWILYLEYNFDIWNKTLIFGIGYSYIDISDNIYKRILLNFLLSFESVLSITITKINVSFEDILKTTLIFGIQL